ncbi:MAG: amidohydrolase family protein [Thermodesulfobacteriota bacterium]|nr:amidohydrolase family protein [Thermodesulfobacteriota bacterium]
MSKYTHGILPDLVEGAANIFTRGKLVSPKYKRTAFPAWDVKLDDYVLFSNANIIDVDQGRIEECRGILVRNGKIEKMLLQNEVDDARKRYPVKKEVDCHDNYLMPGLSDTHAHISSLIESISFKAIPYLQQQREKNCEVAIQNGTTFIRDVGASETPKMYLRKEIEGTRLIGPTMITSYTAVIPKGGMWDYGKLINKIAEVALFGGKFLYFIKSRNELLERLEHNMAIGAELIKTYQEEKPLYGFKQDTIYKMWSMDDLRTIVEFAKKHQKRIACHAMFIKGARMAIEAGVNSLEHMTVDSEYTLEDAEKMAEKNIAIVPTLGVGLYLAIELGKQGYYNDNDLQYFKEYRKKVAPRFIRDSVVPEFQAAYLNLAKNLDEGYKNNKMPMIGPIWPDRVTGFAHFVRKSFENFRKAGVKVGIGTDGGLGISFTGLLEPELHLSNYLGYSVQEILRMATLGNMEICGLEKERGSITTGKVADLLLLRSNPLDSLDNVRTIEKVFKDGRLYYQNALSGK